MQAVMSLMQALIPALLMNICIVGLNQIFDVPIDRINKPYLPLASGEFSMRMGASLVSSVKSSFDVFRGKLSFLHSVRLLRCDLQRLEQPCKFVLRHLAMLASYEESMICDEMQPMIETEMAQVIGTGALALALGIFSGSGPLLATLMGSLVLGIAYSTDLPFLRWKQHPILAAGCILSVR